MLNSLNRSLVLIVVVHNKMPVRSKIPRARLISVRVCKDGVFLGLRTTIDFPHAILLGFILFEVIVGRHRLPKE
jgi:hypothetical protein